MPISPSPTPRQSRRRWAALSAALLCVALLSGCFTLASGKNYAIGMETTRANVVVHTVATKFLYGVGTKKGPDESRNLLLAAAPPRIPISAAQRLAICSVSLGLCLSADQIGRTILSWFKDDIRKRGDYWEAMRSAGRNGRCFAWTFAPSRNLTTKGIGTAGCRAGVLR